MPVRIRLALHGHRHNRIFHLVAMNQRSARNSRPIETLGIYNPRLQSGETHKTIEWSVDRIKWWLDKGALPSKPVVKILELGQLIPPGSKYHPKATGPRNQSQISEKIPDFTPQFGTDSANPLT